MPMIFSAASRKILEEWARNFRILADAHGHSSDLAEIMTLAANGKECPDDSLLALLELINEPSDTDDRVRQQSEIISSEIRLYMAVDG